MTFRLTRTGSRQGVSYPGHSATTIRQLLLGALVFCASLPLLNAQTIAPAPSRTDDDSKLLPMPLNNQGDRAFVDLTQRVTELENELRTRKDFETNNSQQFNQSTVPLWADRSNDKWTVKFGGHVQLDYINWANADSAIPETIVGPPATPGTQDYFEFRRLRIVAEGKGYDNLDFRLQMTLEPETVGDSDGDATSPDVKDAYLSMNDIPWLGRFRIGNFFVPFSLEQVTNDTFNVFLERSIPSQGVFAADREVGFAIYNATEDKNVTWACGAFFDSISDTLKERIDDKQGYRLSSRVTWLPYFDESSNGRYLVHLGAGALFTDDQNNEVQFRARPHIHEGPRLIDSDVLNADSYTTGNIEFAVVWGPFAVQSEAFLSRVNLLAGDTAMVGGAYAHLSYFLTGESRVFERFGQHGAQFGRNVPKTNFFLTSDGVGSGAWEAKARWSHLNLNDVSKGEYNDLTVGMNWYWSDRTRVMFDWIHPVTRSQTTFGKTESDLLAMRFDFNW